MRHDGVIPAFWLFWLYYGMFAGEIVNCFLAVNRFTVVSLKHNYARFWKRNLKYFMAFALIVPFFFTWQFFFTDTQIVIFDDDRPESGYTIQELDRFKLMGRTFNTMFVFGCTSISSFVMNAYVTIYLINQMYLPKSLRNRDRNTDESPTNKRFFAYNCFTFSMECLTAILQLFMFLFKYGTCTNPILYHVQIFVGDLTSLGPVWFMFFINRELRRDIFRLIRLEKYGPKDFMISRTSNSKASQVSFMNS
uniref:Serpentine receptor class gamma n=1 Tax=Panagrellus redivivus TaxID=6233 RepID=A0A7E4ZZS1_PANRE